MRPSQRSAGPSSSRATTSVGGEVSLQVFTLLVLQTLALSAAEASGGEPEVAPYPAIAHTQSEVFTTAGAGFHWTLPQHSVGMAFKKHAELQKKPIEGSFWRTQGYANGSDIVTTVSQPIALQTITVRGAKPMRRARMLAVMTTPLR
jgi:hypothetical protein